MPHPVPEASESGAGPFAYQPALDGVRGVAVTLVLLFHGGFQWMSGGYVGVSVFFTLSGFLITSLLLLEYRRTGTVRWSAFLVRRAKRLLPASLLCLVLIAMLAAMGEFEGVPGLRRDVLSAVLHVANWNSLAGSGSYAELLNRAIGVQSPVDHFWSLAVEEQFYWVWPLTFLALSKLAKRVGRMVTVLTTLAIAGVVAARLIALRWGADAAYWATPARLGEILVGAAAAAGCARWQGRPRWLGWVGVAGLAVVLWAAIAWPSQGGPAYQGWLGVFSVSSMALIVGLQADGWLRRPFSVAPLVWLGRISYGVYVFHWPIFLLVSRRSVHLDGWSLFAVRLTITLAVAVLSFWLLEQPVRGSSWSARRVLVVAAPVMAAVTLFATLVVPAQPVLGGGAGPAPTVVASTTTTAVEVVTSRPTDSLASTSSEQTVTTQPPQPSTTLLPGPMRVLLIGDSTAVALQPGLDVWAAAGPDRSIVSVALAGCGLVRNASMIGDPGDVLLDQCADSLDNELPTVLREQAPDTAIIMVTMSDVVLRQWSQDEGMLATSDRRYADRMLADYRALAEELFAGGVEHIVWVSPVLPATWWYGWTASEVFKADTWVTLDRVIDTVAADHPDEVEVLQLDEWMTASGLAADVEARTDGLHLTPYGATRIVDELIAPVLLRIATM